MKRGMRFLALVCLFPMLLNARGSQTVKMAAFCLCVKDPAKARLIHSCIYPASRPEGKYYRCEIPPKKACWPKHRSLQ